MKKKASKPKREKYVTQDFFTKKLTETIQDLKGFMLETFATKAQLDQKVGDLREEMVLRFEKVDERFEQMDERFEQVDRRFEQMDERFEQVDRRFEQMDERFEQMDKRFNSVDETLVTLVNDSQDTKEKFEAHDKRLAALEQKN